VKQWGILVKESDHQVMIRENPANRGTESKRKYLRSKLREKLGADPASTATDICDMSR
jgi:hypothetical protein